MTTTMTPTFLIQRSGERYHAKAGWLDTYHSFSFADYYDPENQNWGALRVFNDDRIEGGTGFPPHPHKDMEIVTYVFTGELAHKDSIGNSGVVGPGGVQFMSAGTGVRHSEFNNKPDAELHLVQMWVLPGKTGMPPSYGQMDFPREDRLNRWLTIVSGQESVDAPIRITQKATFKVSLLENSELLHEFAPKRFGFLFVKDGSIEANGEKLHPGDAVRLFDVERLSLKGSGEIVLWDLPDA
ncbi:MAG TPA: pirin family protein [Candidatus Acidoferrales bacterium]|jgi:redox-sensitive bicupin YhaK (pirin superfamily)|nr:pirin family protein [Candidatus Acidoferrales bacterium]